MTERRGQRREGEGGKRERIKPTELSDAWLNTKYKRRSTVEQRGGNEPSKCSNGSAVSLSATLQRLAEQGRDGNALTSPPHARAYISSVSSVRPLPIVTWARFVYLEREWNTRMRRRLLIFVTVAEKIVCATPAHKKPASLSLFACRNLHSFRWDVALLASSPQKEWGIKLGTRERGAGGGFIASKSWVASGVGICFEERERERGLAAWERSREGGRERGDSEQIRICKVFLRLLQICCCSSVAKRPRSYFTRYQAQDFKRNTECTHQGMTVIV